MATMYKELRYNYLVNHALTRMHVLRVVEVHAGVPQDRGQSIEPHHRISLGPSLQRNTRVIHYVLQGFHLLPTKLLHYSLDFVVRQLGQNFRNTCKKNASPHDNYHSNTKRANPQLQALITFQYANGRLVADGEIFKVAHDLHKAPKMGLHVYRTSRADILKRYQCRTPQTSLRQTLLEGSQYCRWESHDIVFSISWGTLGCQISFRYLPKYSGCLSIHSQSSPSKRMLVCLTAMCVFSGKIKMASTTFGTTSFSSLKKPKMNRVVVHTGAKQIMRMANSRQNIFGYCLHDEKGGFGRVPRGRGDGLSVCVVTPHQVVKHLSEAMTASNYENHVLDELGDAISEIGKFLVPRSFLDQTQLWKTDALFNHPQTLLKRCWVILTLSGSIWQCRQSIPMSLSMWGLKTLLSWSLFLWYKSSDSRYQRLNVICATWRKMIAAVSMQNGR